MTTAVSMPVEWSDYRDWQAGNMTVREAIDASPHREAFMTVLGKFAAKANSHERVRVLWWNAPRVYIEVTDTRLHHPCSMRALISFDLSLEEFSHLAAHRRYVFARRGWGALVDSIACYGVARYDDCAHLTHEGTCPPLPSLKARKRR